MKTSKLWTFTLISTLIFSINLGAQDSETTQDSTIDSETTTDWTTDSNLTQDSNDNSNAQNSTDSSSDGEIRDVDLGKSVVSASGYEQSIKTAPASISIVPQEEILSRPIRDLGDAVQDVPGVALDVQKTGASQIYMRGLSAKYTLILIDGKRQSVNQNLGGNGFGFATGLMPPASMIERIEVIRGPASVIYGSDAMGGVINIITKKNPSKVTGSFMVEGRFQQDNEHWGDSYGFNGFISAPLIQDTLSVTFRGRYNKSGANKFLISEIEGYNYTGTNPYTSHSPTDYTLADVGGRVNWTIDSQNNIYLDSDLNYQKLGSMNTSSSQYTAVRDIYKWNSVLNHDGSYSWGNLTTYIQFDLTSQVPRQTSGSATDTANYGNTHMPYNKGSVQETKNIIFSSTWNDSYDFNDWGALIGSVGLYYMYENLEVKSSGYNEHINQAAIYGEAEYLPFDLLSATFGLRLNYSDLYSATPNPRFYININPTEWFTIKAGVASGMMIPNVTYLYDGYTTNSNNVDVYGNKDLEAEKTWSYEISTIFDTPFANIVLTGFYTDFQDAVNTITYNNSDVMPFYGTCNGAGGCTTYANVDNSIAAGAEVGFNMKRFYGIGFDFSYAYTWTKQLSGEDKGLPLNTVPRHNFSAKISYNYEAFDVFLRWTGKLRTPTYSAHSANAGVGDFYKDVNVLDLGTSYKFMDAYTLSFLINNLLNKNFVQYVTYQGTRSQSYTNLYQRMLPGINFWVSIKADF